jgi:hypothetical protein
MHKYIFGVRHHGPGSAKSLKMALEACSPDCVLVEGPPDAEKVLPLLAHEEMQPPVALLIYVPEKPQRAVYYPFAVFSPEWQALRFALNRNLAVGFMDLPQSYRLAESNKKEEKGTNNEELRSENNPLRVDPIGVLAEAAGFSDSERWWEYVVEHRRDGADLFAAILEAMTAIRSELPPVTDLNELRREAYMRQTIRAAEREGFERIAVVCGAWHAPALAEMPPAKEDAALVKNLPKIKVQATWVPWTYGRLTYASGYGAGIQSPGWYDHIWHSREQVATRWMAKVAALLREEDLDASSASVIEAVRLAESLAALRQAPIAGLQELNEATQTVLCFGSDAPMRLIHEKLIVSERLGAVPEATAMVPLAGDLQRQQKRLRLKPEATERVLTLDLRKELDLERSHLLHRLNLLGIRWGQFEQTYGKKGTFNETWRLQWQPEFAIALIEAGVYGNTILDAATGRVSESAAETIELPELTKLLDATLLAALPEATNAVMRRLQTEAALTGDVRHLMGALPPLVNVLRYGNVRKTDNSAVAHIVNGIVTRIFISLPVACASLADEAADEMFRLIMETDSAIGLLENETYLREWRTVLRRMAERETLHGLIAGRCCRILLDSGEFNAAEAARRMNLALSRAKEPAHAAAWVEGFLKGSGLLLLHDDRLWQTLDEWVTDLRSETFTELLPLLRRTFATFAAPERRQMGERVRRSAGGITPAASHADNFDEKRAEAVLPLIARLLGIEGVQTK